MCVQLDVNRMIQLNARAKNYAGPISAVVFVVDNEDVEKVKQYLAASAHIRKWVDIHLYHASPKATGEAHVDLPNEAVFEGDAKVLGQKLLYPANLMRNMAVEEARTKWIISIEVDLAFAPEAKDVFNGLVTKLMMENKAEAGERKAYVVPLLQVSGGGCAGDGGQTIIRGAGELPKFGAWEGDDHKFVTPSVCTPCFCSHFILLLVILDAVCRAPRLPSKAADFIRTASCLTMTSLTKRKRAISNDLRELTMAMFGCAW